MKPNRIDSKFLLGNVDAHGGDSSVKLRNTRIWPGSAWTGLMRRETAATNNNDWEKNRSGKRTISIENAF